MSRPFGVALLLAGIDETGVHLYHTDPSGTFSEWSAKAIGGGEQGLQRGKKVFCCFCFDCCRKGLKRCCRSSGAAE
jgi:hypothetical protein